MKRLLGVLLLLLALTAYAVPASLPFSGRLSTSAGPVTGPVALTFRLFATPTGGTQLWSETHASVTPVDGLVFAVLGSQTTLDVSLFDGQARYLEVTVGSETLSPRLLLGTVPYAFRADTADRLGLLAEADVQRRVSSTCGSNQAIRAIDAQGQVTCQNLVDVTAGTGIAVNGSAVSLATTGCAAGSVWRFDGAQFACVPDLVGPTYTPGPGVAISGGAIALASAGCPPNGVWHYTGTAWACTVDQSTVDATALTTGTLSTSRYSAWSDLTAEGYLDNNAATDVPTRGQADSRYLFRTGDTATGNLVAPDFRYPTVRTGWLSLASMNITGAGFWHHVGFGESFPAAINTNTYGTIAVSLPHGATVTAMTCVLVDTEATNRIDVELRRVTDSGDTVMARITTTDSGTTAGWASFVAPSIVTPLIDNVVASYYLELYARVSTLNTIGIRRCVLTYTSPGPSW